MGFIDGLRYHILGLRFAFKNHTLLFWGLSRFALTLLIMVAFTALTFAYNREIMDFLWPKPESQWILWIWYILFWMISIFLLSFSAIISFLASQILFSVWIMDHMSEITEQRMGGTLHQKQHVSPWTHFLFLLKQEIPRGILPIFISFMLLIMGWIVVLGPILLFLSALVTTVFLSFDNTDLLQARHRVPFKERFRFLIRTLPFHIGFGIPFLAPGLNIFLLSFAPIGATLYHIDRRPIRCKQDAPW